jgi:NADPH:quinone reductase
MVGRQTVAQPHGQIQRLVVVHRFKCSLHAQEYTTTDREHLLLSDKLLGQAALNIAANAGAQIIATTRNRERFQKLEALGARRVEIESPDLSDRILERKRIDAVLDLVGNSTLLDSLSMVRRGGRVCQAGFLGGLDPVASFNPLLQMPSGVHFSFFGSFVFGTPDFPLSDVPLQAMVDQVAAGRYKAKPAGVFRFEDIREAQRVMEENRAFGKLVVCVDCTPSETI